MKYCRVRFAVTLAAGVCAAAVLSAPVHADERYELGQYLAGDCTPCHQLRGQTGGIPPINGWPVESFVTVMLAYRAGERDHALMQNVARRLSDDDIEALAVYFEKQRK